MSGGHWDYQQHVVNNLADDIQISIDEFYTKDEDGYIQATCFTHPLPVFEELKLCQRLLEEAVIRVQRLDWLLSGDDGEEHWVRRLEEDLGCMRKRQVQNDAPVR